MVRMITSPISLISCKCWRNILKVQANRSAAVAQTLAQHFSDMSKGLPGLQQAESDMGDAVVAMKTR